MIVRPSNAIDRGIWNTVRDDENNNSVFVVFVEDSHLKFIHCIRQRSLFGVLPSYALFRYWMFLFHNSLLFFPLPHHSLTVVSRDKKFVSIPSRYDCSSLCTIATNRYVIINFVIVSYLRYPSVLWHTYWRWYLKYRCQLLFYSVAYGLCTISVLVYLHMCVCASVIVCVRECVCKCVTLSVCMRLCLTVRVQFGHNQFYVSFWAAAVVTYSLLNGCFIFIIFSYYIRQSSCT